ncbi:hypothetical protein ABZ926_25780 [Streptomyces litmocidini]|uniref:hypothetical protein n=1 Tax=Streptomyces TaxID=1883 RepID=UPI000FAD21B6|nr:hypothetical protein [Streptomyces sp. PanSC19]ROQ35502.1 hypothetical protein EDD98_4566 [Streptomyces sp. PanSC19]
MNTRIDTTADDEMHRHDSTLRTCRPARTRPDDLAPDERDGGDPERHIVRGDD